MRRAKDDFDGLHHILCDHLEHMSQTQREISVEEFVERLTESEIAARRGITVNSCDTHRKAAFRSRRDSMTTVADFSTEIDLPDWYRRVEEMSKRHTASQRRRASRKRENRSTSGGDRSNFERDQSNSRGDSEKSAHAAHNSIVLTTES